MALNRGTLGGLGNDVSYWQSAGGLPSQGGPVASRPRFAFEALACRPCTTGGRAADKGSRGQRDMKAASSSSGSSHQTSGRLCHRLGGVLGSAGSVDA